MQKIKFKINFKNKKIIFLILILIALFFVLIIRGCSSKDGYSYGYGQVEKGAVTKTISATGGLEVLNTENIVSEVTGMVVKVKVDFNDEVKKGQLLAKIYSESIERTLMRYRDEIETRRLDKESYERNLKNRKKRDKEDLERRKKILEEKKIQFKENLISEQAMKDAEIDHKNFLLHLEELKKSDEKTEKSRAISDKYWRQGYNDFLKQARARNVYAPFSGVILSRHVENKANVGVGTLLFIMTPTLKKMRLIINVDESDIGAIEVGQNLFFTVSAFPDKKFTGKIKQVRINPIQRGGLVTYESVVLCDNSDLLLKPGMTATAVVEVALRKDVFRIPKQAFMVSPIGFETAGNGKTEKYVWVKKEGESDDQMKRIKVASGLIGDIYAEITDFFDFQLSEEDLFLIKVNITD